MVLLETGNLKCNLDDKLGIVYQISPPQSGWLLAQPMEPLEARILYPIGGVLNPARMNLVCRLLLEKKKHITLLQVFRHEALLLWRAETYPQDVGPQFGEPKREF